MVNCRSARIKEAVLKLGKEWVKWAPEELI